VASRRAAAVVTANFEANLDAIEAYLAAAGAPLEFRRLIGELQDAVIRNLERHPEMGRPFLDHASLSIEGRDRISRLARRGDARSLREYLSGDYLLLYLVIDKTVYLLSIKHHRQLSFALDQFWP
jgi:plasmid stabilization system protein ParE